MAEGLPLVLFDEDTTSSLLKKRKHSELTSAAPSKNPEEAETSEQQENKSVDASKILPQQAVPQQQQQAPVVIPAEKQTSEQPLSAPQLNRVVSPDAIIDGANNKNKKDSKKRTMAEIPCPQNQQQSSNDASTSTSSQVEASTAGTSQEESQDSAVNNPAFSSVNESEAQESGPAEEPPVPDLQPQNAVIEEDQNIIQEEPQQAVPDDPQQDAPPQPQKIPAVVDNETPPTSPVSSRPSSPGSVAEDRPVPQSQLKQAPDYSYKPELLEKLVNQPIKPEQEASRTYLENFLRVKKKFKERVERRRENQKRKQHGKRHDASLLEKNTMSSYFHSMKGNCRNNNRSMAESPIVNRDWQQQGGEHFYQRRGPVLENYQQQSYLPIQENSPNFTPPGSPDSQRRVAPTPERASSPTTSFVADEEPLVNIRDLTDKGRGAEWTCVFSSVAQGANDQFDGANFEDYLQRLLGYRLSFEAGRPGAEVGAQARLLPPEDERTRMENGLKKMDGTLKRHGDSYSTDPSSEMCPVLSYGWRPNGEGHPDDYGLEDFWSAPQSKEEDKDHFVRVTFEGHTGKGEGVHPWEAYFPFGNLFGLDQQFTAEVIELQDNYWSNGIVAVFHWLGDEQDIRTTTLVKEFALFVPSKAARSKDIRIDTAPFTPYYTAQMDDNDLYL